MRKLLTIFLATCACVAACVAFTACGSGNNPSTEHTHDYQTTWSFDEAYHWYSCKGEGCTEVWQKAEHEFVENACSVCLYERVQETPQPSKYEVTEEVFATVFSAENFSNVTIEGYEASINFKCYFSGNKIKMDFSTALDEDLSCMFEIVGTQVFSYVYLQESAYTGWVKMQAGIMELAYLEGMQAVKTLFTGLSFADFQYSNEYYVGEKTFYAGTEDEATLSFKIRFESGVLISVNMGIDEGTEEYDALYKFSNFGTTTVDLPTEYKTMDELNPQTKAWVDYFVFDNVTATKETTQNFVGSTDTYTVTEVMQTNQGKWRFSRVIDYGTLGQSANLAYYDGSQIHTASGNSLGESDLLALGGNWFSIFELLAYVEGSFTEAEEGVFIATQIDFGSSVYKNVKIVIQDDNIKTIEYLCQFGQDQTAIEKITFTNWGNTIVQSI